MTRLLVFAVPVLALYVLLGWNSSSRVFSPVQTFRGLGDSSVNGSTYWREVEIFNIATTMAASPLRGLGLGGQYTEHMPNADISSIYKEYREWPHNTVLGLLLLSGVFAFTALWALYVLVMFLAARSYRMSASAESRVAALGCMASVVCALVMAYGDTGAHYTQFKVLLALAIAVASKLAIATGAWPARGPGGEAILGGCGQGLCGLPRSSESSGPCAE
jgi:O-antigen ligase